MDYDHSRLVLGLCLMLFSSCFFVGKSDDDDVGSLGQTIGGFLQDVQDKSATHMANTQDSVPCLKSLLPCQIFLHSSSPSPVCCIPLQEIVQNDPQCLCTVFKNHDLLKTLNLTQQDALTLPKACGIAANTSICDQESGSPGNSSTTPPSTPSTPPASGIGTSPPATPTGKPADESAATAITSFGIHYIGSLVALIIWTAV